MDYNNIKQILEKYWEGETSLQEENLLHEYFNSDDVVEELKDVQPMFQYFKEEQKHVLKIQILTKCFWRS